MLKLNNNTTNLPLFERSSRSSLRGIVTSGLLQLKTFSTLIDISSTVRSSINEQSGAADEVNASGALVLGFFRKESVGSTS